jgi:hypothetical protein
MCRETTTRITGAALDALGRDLDGLSRELSLLIELGMLSAEETGALTAYLEDLRRLLARPGVPDAPAPSVQPQTAVDLTELYGMVELFAADIDLAYQRLSAAA